MGTDYRNWTRTCMHCQRANITCHVAASVGKFTTPSRRFEHIHLDVIVMPRGEEILPHVYRSFHTLVRGVPHQEAETVAKAFYEGWICRFGTPLRVTTD